MPTMFGSHELDRLLPLPPDMREWLPERHLAHHVSDLVKVLLCGYAPPSHGIVGRPEEDMAFRVLGAGNLPSHGTLCGSRRRHLEDSRGLFSEVVRVARRMGLAHFGRIGGHRLVNQLQEVAGPDRTVPTMAYARHLAGGHVEGGERGCRPVAPVVVSAPFRRSRPHGRVRLGPVPGSATFRPRTAPRRIPADGDTARRCPAPSRRTAGRATAFKVSTRWASDQTPAGCVPPSPDRARRPRPSSVCSNGWRPAASTPRSSRPRAPRPRRRSCAAHRTGARRAGRRTRTRRTVGVICRR